MAKRKSISKKTRFEVFKRDSFTCRYCGTAAPTAVLRIDHIQPVSKGGDNDLLNLITACFDCNAGKSDRLLSDDSVVQKQKAQLDELQERREQIEMMLDWRNGLRNLADVEVDGVSAAWVALSGYRLNDRGRVQARTLIKKYGLEACLIAVEKAESYLLVGDDSLYTPDSVELAWKRVGGICRMDSLPEWKQRLYHIRNIARKRSGEEWFPQKAAEIYTLFEEAYEAGDSFEQLEDLATRGIGYRELPDVLRDWIKQSKRDCKSQENREQEQENEARIAQEHDEQIEAIIKEGDLLAQGDNAAAVDLLQSLGEMAYPN